MQPPCHTFRGFGKTSASGIQNQTQCPSVAPIPRVEDVDAESQKYVAKDCTPTDVVGMAKALPDMQYKYMAKAGGEGKGIYIDSAPAADVFKKSGCTVKRPATLLKR